MTISHVPGIPLRNYDRLRIESVLTPAPPYCWQPPQILGVISSGQTLTIYEGVWTGADPLTFGYQWTKDGTVIPDATSKTYVCGPTDEAGTFSVRVQATDLNSNIWYAFSGPTNFYRDVSLQVILNLHTLINKTLFNLPTWNGS